MTHAITQTVKSDPLFLIYDVARLMRLRADQHARRDGMTRAQWVILIWLEMQPGLSQNELAGLVEVEPITIARLVDRLEARGLVERRADPRDRRVRRLHLTEAACPVLKQIRDYLAELQAILGAGIPSQEVERITAALQTMKANLLNERRECAATG
jgi:DNA-binding MarR family transcriptional regulator